MKKISRFLLAQYRDLKILFHEFRWSLLAFAVVNLLGAFLLQSFYTLEPLDFSKAAYAVFNMIFFQQSLQFPPQWYLQLFFFCVPLIGLGVIVEGFVRFGALVLNKTHRGEAWFRVLAGTFENHIIVCGLGHVGCRIVEELIKLDEDLVAIEKDREGPFVDRFLKQGVPVLFGDAKNEPILEEAGISKAKAIVIATDNDLANLETAFNAKAANPGIRIVIRLFDPQLASKVQKAMNIDLAFSTSAIAAPVAAAATLEKGVLHSFYVGKELLHLTEVTVNRHSEWNGKTIGEMESATEVTVVVHQKQEGTDLHPSIHNVIQEGDRLVFLASLPILAKLRKREGNSSHPQFSEAPS